MADWSKHLEDILKCPVCLETFREPPIYLCENQHGMCFKCRTSVMNPEEELAVICCPVCKSKLTEKRSLYVEQILEKLLKKCKHDNCDFIMSKEIRHEAKCRHRLVPCGNCDTWISLLSLTQHLGEVHNRVPIGKEDPITLGTRFPIRFTFLLTGMWRLSIRDTADQFYLHMNQYPLDNDYMLVWVSCSLPEPEAANYTYTINVSGPKSLCYTRKMHVVSCDVYPRNVKRSNMAGVRCVERVCNAFITIQPTSDNFR